jgi:hypothetical protein
MVDRAVLKDIIREVLAEQAPATQPSLWDKFKAKMSEQGSQRGLFAIIPLVSYQLNVPVEDMVAILTFVLGMIGINNIVTEG